MVIGYRLSVVGKKIGQPQGLPLQGTVMCGVHCLKQDLQESWIFRIGGTEDWKGEGGSVYRLNCDLCDSMIYRIIQNSTEMSPLWGFILVLYAFLQRCRP